MTKFSGEDDMDYRRVANLLSTWVKEAMSQNPQQKKHGDSTLDAGMATLNIGEFR
jgi:hypothetical protein